MQFTAPTQQLVPAAVIRPGFFLIGRNDSGTELAGLRSHLRVGRCAIRQAARLLGQRAACKERGREGGVAFFQN